MGRIIAKGEGIGGDVSFSGSNLNLRGVEVSGEDTSIYNPGLTLMSQDEKDYIVKGLHKVKSSPLKLNSDSQGSLNYLIGLLDPLHTYELSSYLARLPITTAASYFLSLAVIFFARDVFPYAYVAIVLVGVMAPALFAIVFG